MDEWIKKNIYDRILFNHKRGSAAILDKMDGS